MNRISAALGLAFACVLLWLSPEARAQKQSKPPARTGDSAGSYQEFHIEVNTLPGCFFYGCEQPVMAGNIRVTAGGVRVPVRVAQPLGSGTQARPVPVHLLVAFAPGVDRPADAQLMAKLHGVLAAGWLVSLCRTDGTFTEYAHAVELRRMLSAPSDSPKADAGLDMISEAIEGLRAEPGYRIVLVDMGGKSDDKFVRWLASVADRLSPIYVNDGGKSQMPSSPSAEEGYGVNPLSGAASKKERAYMDGVFHETGLAQAMSHALADTRYDYDVRFRIPAGNVDNVPVQLMFLDPGTHLPFELRTDLYTIEMRDSSGKPAGRRADATARLKTVEK